MSKIYVEIGANNGDDTQKMMQHGFDKVYVCEPDPALINQLCARFAHNPKVKIWPYAIDLTEEEKTFHVMAHERGINSLHPLHPELLSTPLSKHWQYRQGMTHTINVATRRLDTLVRENDIDHIDYLWIDAQGNDLIALQSLGELIYMVREGRLECTYKVPIYEGVDNTYESVVKFLEANWFEHEIVYVHQDQSEVDVRFWRKQDANVDSNIQQTPSVEPTN